jgi:hypothetical protein
MRWERASGEKGRRANVARRLEGIRIVHPVRTHIELFCRELRKIMRDTK